MNTNPNKLLFFNEELIKYIVLKDYTYLFMFRLVINDDITLPAMAELPISQKDIPALQNLTTRNLIISTKKEWKQSPLPGSTIISTTLDANHGIISYKNVVTTIDVALNLEETDNIVEKYDEALCYELLQQILSCSKLLSKYVMKFLQNIFSWLFFCSIASAFLSQSIFVKSIPRVFAF